MQHKLLILLGNSHIKLGVCVLIRTFCEKRRVGWGWDEKTTGFVVFWQHSLRPVSRASKIDG